MQTGIVQIGILGWAKLTSSCRRDALVHEAIMSVMLETLVADSVQVCFDIRPCTTLRLEHMQHASAVAADVVLYL